MKKRHVISLVGAALVLGLAMGTVATGFAATSTTSPTVAECGGGLGGAMRAAGGRLVDVVAKLTGLSAEDVEAKRAAGDSFAKIADAEGVDDEAVVAEALKVREAALAERVAAGTITQEQADAALERMTARITDRVSSTEACTGNGGGGRGMRGGRGGMGGGCGAGGGCGMSATTPEVQ